MYHFPLKYDICMNGYTRFLKHLVKCFVNCDFMMRKMKKEQKYMYISTKILIENFFQLFAYEIQAKWQAD